MARLFNVEVFNQTISGDASPPVYYSQREQQGTLGGADLIYVQVIIEGITDVTGAFSVTYQISNTANEDEWIDSGKTLSATPGGLTNTTLPKSYFFLVDNSNGGMLGAFGRFKVTWSKNSMATIRIIACGHSN